MGRTAYLGISNSDIRTCTSTSSYLFCIRFLSFHRKASVIGLLLDEINQTTKSHYLCFLVLVNYVADVFINIPLIDPMVPSSGKKC